MYLEADEGELLVNLEQVKIVDQITDSTARLMLLPNLTVTVNGHKAVSELVSLLGKYCVVPDGTPLLEALSKAEKSHKPE
jgi:hypothetical protein